MDLRKAAAGTAAVLLGGALLAGCGDSTADGGDDMDSTMEPTMESTMG
ncbi:hypothetical protein [Demequina sp. NBRC 110053]|nr:hypothetical protein [Demequina sp. NBRC 110053]